MHNLDLNLTDISKIEGKASCEIKVRDGKVEVCRFQIDEYKRFYTQAIRGKDIIALPQLTARICGTCSNAHLLCALRAVEDAIDLTVSEQTIKLRQLLNYGLMIRDHGLHLYVFVLPDIFKKDSILDFDEKDPHEHKFLDDCFKLKAAGNNLGKIVGGRSVHAPFLTVGGFTKLPRISDLMDSKKELENVRGRILDLIELLFTQDSSFKKEKLNFSALIDKKYSFLSGEIIRSFGENIKKENYGDYLEKIIIPYSHASGYQFESQRQMVGALARINIAQDKLNPQTKKDTQKYLSLFPSNDIFHNNLAQAIEILHAVDSSIDIIKNLKIVDEKPKPVFRKEGLGIGIIEAPRGTLYYRLDVTNEGKVKQGQIVVPTGQNQLVIEESIKDYLEKNITNLDSKKETETTIEKIVRAFDPCMSCASHFLKIKWI